jgi:hypothetical protein
MSVASFASKESGMTSAEERAGILIAPWYQCTDFVSDAPRPKHSKFGHRMKAWQ